MHLCLGVDKPNNYYTMYADCVTPMQMCNWQALDDLVAST